MKWPASRKVDIGNKHYNYKCKVIIYVIKLIESYLRTPKDCDFLFSYNNINYNIV